MIRVSWSSMLSVPIIAELEYWECRLTYRGIMMLARCFQLNPRRMLLLPSISDHRLSDIED